MDTLNNLPLDLELGFLKGKVQSKLIFVLLLQVNDSFVCVCPCVCVCYLHVLVEQHHQYDAQYDSSSHNAREERGEELMGHCALCMDTHTHHVHDEIIQTKHTHHVHDEIIQTKHTHHVHDEIIQTKTHSMYMTKSNTHTHTPKSKSGK